MVEAQKAFSWETRRSRDRLFEVLIAILVFLSLAFMLSMLRAPEPGAIALLMTLLLVNRRLHHLGMTWRELGLVRPDSIGRTVLVALAAYLSIAVAVAVLVNPLADSLGWHPQSFAVFGAIQGNLPYAVFKITVIGWGVAAFGEELLFRGFLLNRIESAFAGGRWAIPIAVIGQAALFGLGHIYLGARGALIAGVVGLVFGIFYLKFGRNLWPLIIAHGITDTISLLAIYAGLAPGV